MSLPFFSSMPFVLSLIFEYKELELFLIMFVGSTVIPIPTDAFLAASLYVISPFWVFVLVVAGGTCGSLLNYVVGLKGLRGFFAGRNVAAEKKAEKWFSKWGQIVVVVHPFVPFLGDPMTVVAGALRMDFWRFLGLVVIGKAVKTLISIILFYYALGALNFW